MAEDIVDITVTNYNDSVTLDIQPNVTVVNISNLSGLTGIIIPSGTVGKLPYYDTTTTFADSNIWTDGASVGINTTTPTFYSTNRGMVVRNGSGNVEMILQHDGNTAASIQGLTISNVKTDGAYIFNRENLHLTLGTNDTARIKILPSGRVLMGSSLPTDDTSSALQINGNVKVSENIGIGVTTVNITNYKSIDIAGATGTFYRAYSGVTETFRIQTTSTVQYILALAGGIRFDTESLTNALVLSTAGQATFGAKVIAPTLRLTTLPTSASGLSTGDVWNDSGTLKIV